MPGFHLRPVNADGGMRARCGFVFQACKRTTMRSIHKNKGKLGPAPDATMLKAKLENKTKHKKIYCFPNVVAKLLSLKLKGA